MFRKMIKLEKVVTFESGAQYRTTVTVNKKTAKKLTKNYHLGNGNVKYIVYNRI